jgi:LmbE family N-acetylglucosaminyl deacetylase
MKIIICAHPDDEMLFSGQLLVEDNMWKIICVTSYEWNGCQQKNLNDFKRIMKELNINYEIWDYIDYGFNPEYEKRNTFEHYNKNNTIENQLEELLTQQYYTQIVTHNPNGEYGHPQHIALSYIVFNICKKHSLLDKLYNFDLTIIGREKRIQRNVNHNYYNSSYKEIIFTQNITNEREYSKDILEKKIKYCNYYTKAKNLLSITLKEFRDHSTITKCNYQKWKSDYWG